MVVGGASVVVDSFVEVVSLVETSLDVDVGVG